MLPSLLSSFPGELAALTAALIWAVASVIYSNIGRQLSPLMLNLAKGTIAIVLLLLTLLLRGELFPAVSSPALAALLFSGAIGIGFGDTAYFQALNCLGARRSLILEALAPPIAALLALVFLQESLSIVAWLGIALTVLGVIWVVVERTPDAPTPQPQHWQGIGFGVLAACGQAGGAVLSRSALSGTTIDPLWSSCVRLAGGMLVLLVWLVWQRRSPTELKVLNSRQFLVTLLSTAFASTYLAIWLQQISLKYAPAGIAQALSATSPLFVPPIALYGGEKVSFRAFLGALIALAGIWLLFDRV